VSRLLGTVQLVKLSLCFI